MKICGSKLPPGVLPVHICIWDSGFVFLLTCLTFELIVKGLKLTGGVVDIGDDVVWELLCCCGCVIPTQHDVQCTS